MLVSIKMQKSLPNNDVYDIVCLNQQYRCKKANIQNMLYGKTCWNHPHVPVKSKKDWQHNGQQKDKKTDNILQNTTQKIKGRATRTPLKASGEFRCSGRVGSSSFIGGTRRVAPVALEIQVLARDRDMWMVSTGFTIKHVLNVCFFTSILLI
jgi:hypothetical protein